MLTFYQRHVLLALDGEGPRAASEWGAWYPMHTDQARGVIRGLYQRGLVDVAGFEGRSRTYHITERGRAALAAPAPAQVGLDGPFEMETPADA